MRRSEILHALSAIAGFAAGGALVTLVVAMMPPPAPEAVALASVSDGAERPLPVAVEVELRPRAGLPTPTDPRLETGPAAAPPSRSTIDADSLATLVEVLRDRDLELPVTGIGPDDLRDDYGDPRPGGRTHEALDILAPRGTPVVAGWKEADLPLGSPGEGSDAALPSGARWPGGS